MILDTPRIRRPGPVAKIDAVIDQRLDPQALREHRREHHARVGDRPLIIEHHDRRVVHHEGDLLSEAAAARNRRYQAPLGRSLHPNARTKRWIKAKHILIPPYTPRWNGKIERFFQTAKREWSHGRVWQTSRQRDRALSSFLRFYNRQRPHSAAAGRPPITRVH